MVHPDLGGAVVFPAHNGLLTFDIGGIKLSVNDEVRRVRKPVIISLHPHSAPDQVAGSVRGLGVDWKGKER